MAMALQNVLGEWSVLTLTAVTAVIRAMGFIIEVKLA
jgi:hypothetical protein